MFLGERPASMSKAAFAALRSKWQRGGGGSWAGRHHGEPRKRIGVFAGGEGVEGAFEP